MKNIATKKATNQFQRVLDKLGSYRGKIKTNTPGMWWDLELEVVKELKNGKWIFIGISKRVGDIAIFDPVFSLIVTMNKDKVEEIKVWEYISETAIGRFYIDAEDVMHCAYGTAEKDSVGMKKRFSQFMNSIVESGAYLEKTLEVIKYKQPVEESRMLQKFMQLKVSSCERR